MAQVISITIIESAEQIVSGIPKSISITTNIAANIFYTLDGTDPSLFSTIYTGPIFLPINQFLITLKVLATNGVDYSPIVVEQYQTDIVDSGARLPHAGTTAPPGSVIPDAYPFGNPPCPPKQAYTNPAKSGVNVYDPSLPAIPNGFDGQGNPANFSNQPYDSDNYQIIYSTRDAEGIQNNQTNNLPGQVGLPMPTDILPDTAQTSNQGPEFSNQFTTLFDPRALVVFQDFSKEDPNDPSLINRQFFSYENPERARDGTLYYNTGLDATAPPSGSFVRAHYNPRTNTITHYYRDSWSNKWVISTSPYQPNSNFDGNLAQSVVGRNSKIFEWIPFARRVLF